MGDPARVSAQVDAYRKEDQNPEHGLNDLRLVVEAALPADQEGNVGVALAMERGKGSQTGVAKELR